MRDDILIAVISAGRPHFAAALHAVTQVPMTFFVPKAEADAYQDVTPDVISVGAVPPCKAVQLNAAHRLAREGSWNYLLTIDDDISRVAAWPIESDKPGDTLPFPQFIDLLALPLDMYPSVPASAANCMNVPFMRNRSAKLLTCGVLSGVAVMSRANDEMPWYDEGLPWLEDLDWAISVNAQFGVVAIVNTITVETTIPYGKDRRPEGGMSVVSEDDKQYAVERINQRWRDSLPGLVNVSWDPYKRKMTGRVSWKGITGQ